MTPNKFAELVFVALQNYHEGQEATTTVNGLIAGLLDDFDAAAQDKKWAEQFALRLDKLLPKED